ncbi:MAG: hypothetical protein Ct9H300mP11_21240 [Chloroflexota bacterium]|nr:MAG: hypothetical protein Ct9H300mP11_21240 [Chloroflexota bacterium]
MGLETLKLLSHQLFRKGDFTIVYRCHFFVVSIEWSVTGGGLGPYEPGLAVSLLLPGPSLQRRSCHTAPVFVVVLHHRLFVPAHADHHVGVRASSRTVSHGSVSPVNITLHQACPPDMQGSLGRAVRAAPKRR